LALPAGAEAAAAAIEAGYLEAAIAHLASDSLGGRGPATGGDRAARRYLVQQLQAAGCEPDAPGGAWEQPLDLVGITSHMPPVWSFRGGGGALELAWWDDYIAGSGVQEDSVAVGDTEIVFVGYGITAPEENWDDFKGADVRGKVLLVLNNDPDWDPALFAGNRRLYYGRWDYKYEHAARQGAAGAIIVHTTPSAGYPWKVVQTSWSGEQFELPAGGEPRLRLAAWVTEAAARRLAARGGRDLDSLVAAARRGDFRPVPLGVRTSIAFRNTLHRGSRTANVAGLLRGRDPSLRSELVVFTAHHDHLGTGEPDSTGDRIYNGARDNAAGAATVLAVARAFAALPERPRRSVLFMLVAAEEQGLLGSEWFAAHPSVPPGRIAANINIDAPNIFGRTRDVAVIGRGKSSLEDVLAAAAALQGRVVVDEPTPDKGYYYRSDQFNFAKIGVPALYFKAGTEYLGRPAGWGTRMEDAWRESRYHQPGDVVYADWNFDGLVEDAQLAFYVGLAAAAAAAAPAWKPGDEFEAVRERALRELSSP
jgi:Zn-dependent M28 family amino/carboxypeptidase